MSTQETKPDAQRIGRAWQLLRSAEEEAMSLWESQPTSTWLLHANALMIAREALATLSPVLSPGEPLAGEPVELARQARDELRAVHPEAETVGLSLAMVCLADALRDLEGRL